MKVFISWSGDVSRQVAEVLRDWLPSVIQAIEPYVSSEDIDKGARWSADISQELEESNYGILCVTKSNLGAPWLNFEAGALSKSVNKSRVSPFLVGIGRNEVTGPLLQFQATVYEKEDVHKLIRSINSSCKSGLEEVRLDGIFEVWWPSLHEKLDVIAESADPDTGDAPGGSRRSNEDLLNEILHLVRAQQKILTHQMEQQPIVESLLRQHSAELANIVPSFTVQELDNLAGDLESNLRRLIMKHEDSELDQLLHAFQDLRVKISKIRFLTQGWRRFFRRAELYSQLKGSQPDENLQVPDSDFI